jgi:hypothetical protein
VNADAEKARLSQDALFRELILPLQATEMVTVYLSDDEGLRNHGIYRALVPTPENNLASPRWDLMPEFGYPVAVQSYDACCRRNGGYSGYGSYRSPSHSPSRSGWGLGVAVAGLTAAQSHASRLIG